MTKPVLSSIVAILALCSNLCMSCAAKTGPSVPRYGKFEATFSVSAMSGNPYDPTVNDVDAVFTPAKHTPITVPAFWNGTTWLVRFSPTFVGAYHLQLTYNGTVINPSDLSADSFECVPSSDSGFIHLDPKNTQRFLFSNGTPYYPIGADFAWQNDKQIDYPEGLAKFGKAGMNWARIWMNNWDGKNLEWGPSAAQNPAIGTYYQPAAQRWDSIMDSASTSNVYVQMCLQHHGQYTAVVNPNWQDNPFNAANGGWLQKPDDFFTDPKAIALTKAKYRYIEARYGYSTHLFAFELFNEVANIREASSHFQDVVAWHNTMAAYIRSIDPYHHLITTSYSAPSDPLAKADIDFLQIHTYPPDIVSTLSNLPVANCPKPVFVGEWGGGGGGDQPAAIESLHNGLWAGIMAPTAGAAQYWFWDQIDSNNEYPIFKSATDFVSDFGVANLGGGVKLDASATGEGEKGSLSFAPPLEWVPTTSLDITVSNGGQVNGLGGVSSYLQGTGHRDMQAGPLNFHISPSDPIKFIVHFGQVSNGSAHPTLSVDNGAPVELDFPVSDKNHDTNGATLSVDVPAGSHVVSLNNTGVDWIVMSKIELTNFAPPIAVLARGDSRGAAFWAYSRRGNSTSLPANSKVSLAGVLPGKYSVKLWDCQADKALPSVTAMADATGVTVSIPNAVSDVAGYLTPAK